MDPLTARASKGLTAALSNLCRGWSCCIKNHAGSRYVHSTESEPQRTVFRPDNDFCTCIGILLQLACGQGLCPKFPNEERCCQQTLTNAKDCAALLPGQFHHERGWASKQLMADICMGSRRQWVPPSMGPLPCPKSICCSRRQPIHTIQAENMAGFLAWWPHKSAADCRH